MSEMLKLLICRDVEIMRDLDLIITIPLTDIRS